MKRALPLIVIAALTLLLAAFLADVAVKASWVRAGRRAWPHGLGALEDFPKRFPKAGPTPAASRLTELARPLGIEFTEKKTGSAPDTLKAIGEYVKAQQERKTVVIDAPPAGIETFLDAHEREVDAVRDHLLANGPAIGWSVDLDAGLNAPIPNLLGHMHSARLLTARALVRARRNDPRAWTDLEAVIRLEQSLHKRPDMMSQAIGVSMARMAMGAAWKLPLPVPATFAGTTPDVRDRLILQAWQGEAWVMWRHAVDEPMAFGKPFVRAGLANMALHQRSMGEELANVSECSFDGKAFFERRLSELPRWNLVGRIAMPNIGDAWTRVRRFEVEHEATLNALRVRAGRPILAQSGCSDGSWRYENGTLSFGGREPLTLVISPR